MTRTIGSFALAVLLALSSIAASACSIATPKDYDATQRPVDVVFEGIATAAGVGDGTPFAEIDVATVNFGDFSNKRFRLEWWVSFGGRCEPPGPDVKVGDHIRVYLKKQDDGAMKPMAWEDVVMHPKTRDLIELEQGVARYRKHRHDSYFRLYGALSYNDPKSWLPRSWINDDELQQLREARYIIRVRFDVSRRGGNILNCKDDNIANPKFAYLGERVCKTIAENAKMVPPVFAEEDFAFFSWSPPPLQGG